MDENEVAQNEAKDESKKEEEITQYTDASGLVYHLGNTVYIESQRADMPYFICTVRSFTSNKKDHISVGVVWFYRPCEIPTSVYELLLQDRHTENGSNILDDPFVKSRELFISDAIDVYPASALRGHARCLPFSEIKENLLEYLCIDNNWFYILGYNPESRRMANAKGEIRIGASHQACLPVCWTNRESPESIADLGSTCKEELVWKPTLPKSKLVVYLRAARSITSFSGYCATEDGSPEKALNALSEDNNIAYSYNVLHKNNYDISVALRELIRNPTPKKTKKQWTDEERKKFMQGLRSYGKTFHKIRKEFLPERTTSELVLYYYIWKKTSSAMNSRPHKRGVRRNVLARRTRTSKPKTVETAEFLELSSCSENDMDNTDNNESSNDTSLYACRHCYSTKSRNWHHGGKNKLLLCYSCRMYFKHYGHMKPLSEKEKIEPPAYIFKAAFENFDGSLQYSGRMRTRRSSTPVFANANGLRSRLVQESKVGNQRQVTVPGNVENDSDKEEKEEAEVEVNVTIKGEDDEQIDHLEEAKKQQESAEEMDAEDADDEADEENSNDSQPKLVNHSSTEASPQTPTPEKNSDSDEANDTEERDSSTSTSGAATPTISCGVSSVDNNIKKEEDNSPVAPASTFTPIKEEQISDVEECDPGSSDESPDVPDDEKLLQKIKERFAHNETESGNSCSRCERYYVHKKPRKLKASELEAIKRREEYLQKKDSNQRRHGNTTPPSTHQPAQITSHYETMRLFAAQVARNVEPKRSFWSAGGYQQEMRARQPTSPPEFMDNRKYGHLLDALEARPRVDHRTPHSAAVPGHPTHSYPPRPVDNNRDIRINPPNRSHPLRPTDNISHLPLPKSIDGLPMDRPRIDPLTGLPSIQPHLHSHHHTHTHLHVHPDDLKYNRHHVPPLHEASHFERHERAPPLHQAPQLSAPSHQHSASCSRECHEREHLFKQYPDLLAQMQHDPHLRESLVHDPHLREQLVHHPLVGSSSSGGVGSSRRDHRLYLPRDGAVSPSIPHHDIQSAPSDPVAYHLLLTKNANMQKLNSHSGGQFPSQAPELSPHGMPHLPHDIRNEHEKHMKEKLLYEREQLARAERFRTHEHEKHLRSMLHGQQDHMDSMKPQVDHNMVPAHHSFKRGGGEMQHLSYHSNSSFVDTLRRARDAQVSGHERSFHDSMRFGHHDQLERDRAAYQERVMHTERYPDRAHHERPSIFGNYKPPETIDLSED